MNKSKNKQKYAELYMYEGDFGGRIVYLINTDDSVEYLDIGMSLENDCGFVKSSFTRETLLKADKESKKLVLIEKIKD